MAGKARVTPAVTHWGRRGVNRAGAKPAAALALVTAPGLGNREQGPCQVVAAAALRCAGRGLELWRVTLGGASWPEVVGLVGQVAELAAAVWLVESVSAHGHRHVHGLAALTPAAREAVAVCVGWTHPGHRFERVNGWPRRDELGRNLARVIDYDLRAGKWEGSRTETPLRAWGTGDLEGAGAAGQAFLAERAARGGRVCACGCGELVAGRARYVAGHAARERQRRRRAALRAAAPGAARVPTLAELEKLAAELAAGLAAYSNHNQRKSQ